MNSKDFFEDYYKKVKAKSYSKSLLVFFSEIVRPRLNTDSLNILDMGAGNYSLFEEVKNLKAIVVAVDFSKEAIASSPKSCIQYIEANVVDSTQFPESTYDLIFDSHCLNCITEESDRDLVLMNIRRGLNADGLFAAELMVQSIGETVSMPFKKIKTALELEQEFISHGFRIQYFSISKDSEFRNVVDGIEVNCDVLKLVCQK